MQKGVEIKVGKKIIGIIVITLIFILYFSNIPNEKKSEVLIIEESLNILYNVPNANEFDEYINSIKLTQIHNKYRELFSEKGFKKIKGDRLHTLYRRVAKNSQLTIELKNIEIEKMWVNEKDGSILNKHKKIGYEYKVELFIKYVESDKTETLYEEGYINLVEIDGEWKVDLMTYKVLNELFMKILYIERSVS